MDQPINNKALAKLGVPRHIAHLEPFNGSDVMRSIQTSLDGARAGGIRQAVLTVRIARDSDWSRSFPIEAP